MNFAVEFRAAGGLAIGRTDDRLLAQDHGLIAHLYGESHYKGVTAMEMRWTRRAVVGAALSAVAAPAMSGVSAAQDKPAATAGTAASAPAAKGKLTDQSLGTLLKAMGLEATASEQRYDFIFKSVIEDAEWELSMSAVLSQDGSSIWIMAWLDELPKSAADVPRTALLRLLSDNDKLGKGKFFAYIASNRRFVLQRVIPNENMTTASFRGALSDLGESVVATHAHWSVANWASTSSPDPAEAAKTGAPVRGSAPQASTTTAPGTARPATATNTTNPAAAKPTTPATGRPLQSAVNDSKVNTTTKK